MAEVHSIEIKVDSTQAQTASRNLDKMSGSASGAESALKNLTRAAVGLVALDKLKDAGQAAIKMADAYTEMSSKLRLATGSQEEFNKAQNALFKIAQDNKTALGDTVQLYSRMSVGLKEMGQSQAQTLKMVDAVSKALRISGASTSEASSVITQFGQALGSGVLRGEEFNAVMENGPRLAKALADGLGLPIGQLRKLAEHGMLTSDIVVKAIQSQTGALDQEASMLTTTVSQAWTQFENELTQIIGTMNEQSGTTKDLIELMNQLAPLLIEVAKGGMGALSIATDIATKELLGFKGVFGELFDMFPAFLANLDRIKGKTVAEDPEIAKLMKMGQGQATIEEIAGKPAEPVEKKAAKANVALASTGKAAKKAADEAQRAFEATINANVKAAENAAKLYESQSRTQISRLDLELEKAQELARVETKKAQSQEEKVKIAEQLQAKTVEIINAELALRQAVIDKEAEGTQIKMKGIEDELASADRLKLSQAERIQLQSELNSLQTEQSLKSEERLQAELDAQKQIQDASKAVTDARLEGETSVREEALRTLEVLSSNLEYSREMATGLAEAFGEVGASIGGMTVALAEYEKQQATINIQAEEAIKKNPSKRMEIEAEAMTKQSRNQIKLYGDMTQAAQGFFKKGTKGYESMGAAVKVFRAFEMAQSAMSFAKQMGDMGAMLAQFLGMESAKTTAKIANNAAQQASDSAGAVTSATKAVADAGQGDPYTGIIRAAAMLAFMAAIGIAVGGGGGGTSATTVKPPEPGTGTVKGDPLAVSESISKSIGIIEENSSNDLSYSADMLDALYQIRDALGGVENLIASDLTPAISNLMLKFGDGVKQAGFLFRDQQLSKILSSGRVEGYIGARVETESSQMMVTIKKGQTMVAEYGDKFAKAFGSVVTAIKDSIIEVGKVIGITDTEIMNRLQGFKVKLGTIDIAGLSAEEAAKKIEAAFSAMSDTMAMRALPEFKAFQQSGEGYKETIVRVAEGIQRATGSLELLGMEAINYTDIIDKNKDVAAEITRQTIMAQGDLSEGTRKYVKQLTGSAEDIIDAYKQIIDITNLMRSAGFGTENIDRTMINAAGGLSAFEESLQSFRDNFMSDTQRVTADTIDLTQAFGKLGFALPKSKDEFYNLALGINTSTDEGKKLFAQFMLLNERFSDLTDASQELADAQADAAKEAADAAQKIQDDLIASLQKNVDSAFSAMQKAYQDLQKVQERFLSYSKTIRAYLEELTGGRSTFISPEERYRIARQEFQRISALAVAGDESALAEITKAGKDFLDASREYNASNTQFQSDFTSVTSALEKSSQYAENQASIAENQLTVAANSYNALVTLNTSTLTVAAAVETLNKTMASYANAVATLAKTPTVAPTPAPAPAPAGSPENPIPVPKVPVVVTPAPVREIPGGAAGYNPFASSYNYKWSELDARNLVTFYYRQLLGREPENENVIVGRANQLMAGAISANQLAQEFKSSEEYRILTSQGFIPGFAKGGYMGAGISLVGEAGPELVSSGGGYVSSAGATANFFKTIKDAVVLTSNEQVSLLKEQVGELQALVRLQSAANRELINQLSEIKSETAESTRIAKIEASA